MADLGRIDQRTIRASKLTRAEFDQLKSTYRTSGLWCVECRSPMYPQTRGYIGGRLQLFAHWPDAPESCSAKSGETATHKDLKDLVASIGEQRLGLRAETERNFASHRPDVLLYDPSKPASHGPKAAYEIQQSELDLATFDWRDSRLNSALQKLSTGAYDRRVVPWLFTHTPSYAATRAHVELGHNLDGTWTTTGGIYTSTDLVDTLEEDLAKVMTDMHAGKIVRLQERVAGAPVSYWTTAVGKPTERAAAKLRRTSDSASDPCTRPRQPEAVSGLKPTRNAYRGDMPICTVCGNPIMWTTTRTTHVVCGGE